MKICVYGAASNIIDKSFIDEAENLGRAMGKRGHGLVFGAGNGGVMGAVARGVYEKGGEIIGVAPSFFNVDGILFPYCNKFISTHTMRERKQTMEDSSDAFITAPGGIGTFEEFFEILTLKQLGRHNKPMAILNTNGYYDILIKLLENAAEKDFMPAASLELCKVFTEIEPMLDYIENYNEIPKDIFELRYAQNK